MRPVCVIGLGLIGGSVLRAASAAGRPCWGATTSTEDATLATDDGFSVTTVDDALAQAAKRDALVVIAVPLPAVESVLRKVSELAPRCLLTDVVSVKGPTATLVRRLAPDARYAGGHPMAGAAASGWPAGSATLFQQAAWVVIAEQGVDVSAWRATAELAIDCGAHVVPCDPPAHDDAVARVSHLPHVLAAVLAAVGADGGPLALSLAAGSFRDGTRVAGSRPELVLAMCEGNLDPLLTAVDDALGRLGAARGALASTGSLRATITAGHTGRAALLQHRESPHTQLRVELTAPDAMTALGEIGARGGRVIGFAGETAVLAELPVPDAIGSRLDNDP